MRSFDSDPIEVRLEACYCPGSPHEADLVYLAPELPMAVGMAARDVIVEALTEGPAIDRLKLQEELARAWMRCVVAWNLLDDDGQPIPVTPQNVMAALPYGKGGRLVADKADDMYAGDVMDPLRVALGSTSRPGPTNGSMSRTPRQTRKRSSRSSTATTGKVRRPA